MRNCAKRQWFCSKLDWIKATRCGDAVSFVLMRERQILEALTTDKHFVQEGFVRLLDP
jgi:predicted nucleic acid-binding protein